MLFMTMGICKAVHNEISCDESQSIHHFTPSYCRDKSLNTHQPRHFRILILRTVPRTATHNYNPCLRQQTPCTMREAAGGERAESGDRRPNGFLPLAGNSVPAAFSPLDSYWPERPPLWGF
jgi:hypothetical protein